MPAQPDAPDGPRRRQARRGVGPAAGRQPAAQQPVGVPRVDRDELHGLVAALRSRAQRDGPARDRADPPARGRAQRGARAERVQLRGHRQVGADGGRRLVALGLRPRRGEPDAERRARRRQHHQERRRGALRATCHAPGRERQGQRAGRRGARLGAAGEQRAAGAGRAPRPPPGTAPGRRRAPGPTVAPPGDPVRAQLQVGDRRQREEQQVGTGAGHHADAVLAGAARRPGAQPGQHEQAAERERDGGDAHDERDPARPRGRPRDRGRPRPPAPGTARAPAPSPGRPPATARAASLGGGLADQAGPARPAGGEQRRLGRAPAGDQPGGQHHGGRCERAAQQRDREHAGAGHPALVPRGVQRARERQVHHEVLGAVTQRAAELAAQGVDAGAGPGQVGGGRVAPGRAAPAG